MTKNLLAFLLAPAADSLIYSESLLQIPISIPKSFLIFNCYCAKRALKLSKWHHFVTIQDIDMYVTPF